MAAPPEVERVFKTAWLARAARKDRANIAAAELKAFRELAKAYEKLTGPQLARLLEDKDLTEICHGDQA